MRRRQPEQPNTDNHNVSSILYFYARIVYDARPLSWGFGPFAGLALPSQDALRLSTETLLSKVV